ncbi:MAG: AAA family ATPase [Phycisphaerae bacterium]|nr:AAA family ATPase [Phycisphaerae bacterium]
MPQDLEAERALLGAMAVDPESLAIGLDRLTASAFMLPAHAIVFRVLDELHNDATEIGLHTLKDALSQNAKLEAIGGVEFLVGLGESVVSLPQTRFLCDIVERKHRQRRLYLLAHELQDKAVAADADPTEIIADFHERLDKTGINGHAKSGLVLTRLADVRPERLTWLWPDRIGIGKLTVVSGDPGLGKSFVTLDIAARVSTATPWPDRRDEENPAGSVVILSAEDDIADTIRPRLDAAGADVAKVVAVQAIERIDPDSNESRRCPFLLGRDLPALERAVTGLGDCRLVIIDPISAYLGDTDSHVNAAIRSLLAPLGEMAARLRVAVLAVHHLNKGTSGTRAIYRTSGSLAFVAAARAVWAVAPDKEDPTGRRRLLLPVKNNLGPDMGGLAYRIETDHEDRPLIQWDAATVSVTADEALTDDRPRRKGSKIPEAAAWLRERLARGSERSDEVLAAAQEAGFSRSTVFRAKEEAGVAARKSGFSGGWIWLLPETETGGEE